MLLFGPEPLLELREAGVPPVGPLPYLLTPTARGWRSIVPATTAIGPTRIGAPL